MNTRHSSLRPHEATGSAYHARPDERGAALALALLLLAFIGVIAVSVLAVVSTETRIAGSDLQRTQSFYAAATGIEKMTNDFSILYSRTSRPTQAQLDAIAASPPTELLAEKFTFNQTLAPDEVRLAEMRLTQGIVNNTSPRVTIPNGPFGGLFASVVPFRMRSTGYHMPTKTELTLERDINNYLIPLFQFGMFSNEDIELHPGPAFTFNGRVHANGNIYINGNVTFLDKVTTPSEFIVDVLRNGSVRTGANLAMVVNNIRVPITMGSMDDGPNRVGALPGQRGFFPGSPNGTYNTAWDSTSVAAPTTGSSNRFGGQLQTRSTGGAQLLLPLQLGGNPTRELIKRGLPFDSDIVLQSRYHSKSQIRILIDDENVPANMPGGIPLDAGGQRRGIALSTFDPVRLPNLPIANGGGRALYRISDAGVYDVNSRICQGGVCGGAIRQADTVRGVRAVAAVSAAPDNVVIPPGAGIGGRIFIEIIDQAGVSRDVTREVLSMGMTEGEPNSIVSLQRPLWMAFTQGSRDASGGNNHLTFLMNNTQIASDGEILCASNLIPLLDPTYHYLRSLQDDIVPGARSDAPAPCVGINAVTGTAIPWNNIVPINVYNVREGYLNSGLNSNTVYERGITNVVEVNMRNLARWIDGVYDNNLLAGTPAVSANINGSDGYILYVSDRRGDRIKAETYPTLGNFNMTNGMVDNEDIYGLNNGLDPGEDVIDAGTDGATGNLKRNTLQRDLLELPNPAVLAGTAGGSAAQRVQRAIAVAAWTNPANFFRRAVRLFNGENLQVTGLPGRLSTTVGISVSTENMVYIWGNYNTTGINVAPPAGQACLNDPAGPCLYNGNQIPASIVSDAFFPLSKTWFDSSSALYPDTLNRRVADLNLPNVAAETSVRAGIIAGNNLSALAGAPDAGNGNDSRLSGGMHNFPRFLEDWLNTPRRWNYVGSFVPLYHSTQAMGQWQYPGTLVIYGAPVRNWAFDTTFRDPARLPPGTPQFQYIEPTGFRQIF